MQRRRTVALITTIGILALLPACGNRAGADVDNADCAFVNRPIDLVVPWGAGGGADTFARTIGEQAEDILGQSIVVQNLEGASGEIGMKQFMTMPSNGLALVQVSSDFVLLNAAGESKTDLHDLEFLVRAQYAPSFLWVPEDSRFGSAQDIVDAAESDPGEITIGGSGSGSPDDVAVGAMRTAGIDLGYVAYNEASERYVAPLQGTVDALYEQPGDIQSFLDEGDYRPLLSFTEERVEGYDDVPAVTEFGVEATPTQWRGLAINADAPEEAKSCWESVLQKAVDSKSYRKFNEQAKSDFEEPMVGGKFHDWVLSEFDRATELFES